MGQDAVLIRPEMPEDVDAVREANERAFGGPDEALIVEALRRAGAVTLSLVAEEDGRVLGHILFSPVTVETRSGTWQAVGLAPMAVVPERQRQGIGSCLVREGLEALRRAGHEAVVVLGHPTYYPRFGFLPASRWELQLAMEYPDEAFMAVELCTGALVGRGGVVRFRPEFEGA